MSSINKLYNHHISFISKIKFLCPTSQLTTLESQKLVPRINFLEPNVWHLFQFGSEKNLLTDGMIWGVLLRTNFLTPCCEYFSPSSKFSRTPAALFCLVTLKLESNLNIIDQMSSKRSNIICRLELKQQNIPSHNMQYRSNDRYYATFKDYGAVYT